MCKLFFPNEIFFAGAGFEIVLDDAEIRFPEVAAARCRDVYFVAAALNEKLLLVYRRGRAQRTLNPRFEPFGIVRPGGIEFFKRLVFVGCTLRLAVT